MYRKVAPSILAADFGNIERDVEMLDKSAAQWIHVDVMDGVFVPNITFGTQLLSSVREVTRKILDVHLMVINPERHIEKFAQAGADIITFHLEATDNAMQCITTIRRCGKRVGISIKPSTPLSEVYPYLEKVDMILIMSVEPGCGGQKFIEKSFEKIIELKKKIEVKALPLLIEVDGGVSLENFTKLYSSGVDVLVAGSTIFNSESPQETIKKILTI